MTNLTIGVWLFCIDLVLTDSNTNDNLQIKLSINTASAIHGPNDRKLYTLGIGGPSITWTTVWKQTSTQTVYVVGNVSNSTNSSLVTWLVASTCTCTRIG